MRLKEMGIACVSFNVVDVVESRIQRDTSPVDLWKSTSGRRLHFIGKDVDVSAQ